MLNRVKKLFAHTAPQTGAPASIEHLETRRLMAGTYGFGININDNTKAVFDKAVPKLKALGISTVRIWIGTDFKERTWEGARQRIVDYANAGFDVMAIISPWNGKIPSSGDVKSWFSWALSTPLKGAVDRWQIGNEPDHTSFWNNANSATDMSSYVNLLLKPASEVLHAHGEKVVSAGPSWDPLDVQEQIDAGMLKYADYVGYHPYATENLIPTRVAAVKSIVAGRKPLVTSEWNVNGLRANHTAWAAAVQKFTPLIRSTFEFNYYFALVVRDDGYSGAAGIMYTSGSNTQFYNALLNGKNGSTTPLPTPTPTPTPPPGTNPSAIPSVAKLSVYNADTDKLIVDSLQSGAVLDLATLGTRNLSFVAVTGSGTSSVKFVTDGTTTNDNVAAYTSFGDNGAGNYYGKAFYAGSHSISATPYSADNSGGTKGSTRTFSFTVKNSPLTTVPPAPTPSPTPIPVPTGKPDITSISILNASTGAVISGYSNITSNRSVKLSSLPTRNIKVVFNTSGATKSVKITAVGTTITDNTAPFTTNAFTAWAGNYLFTGSAYAQSNAAGTLGDKLSIMISFY